MKRLLKEIIPKQIFFLYHYCLAILAAVVYRFPANKMIIIGVTGTSGKTTTSYLTAQLLEAAGYRVGLSSTAIFKVGNKEWLNDKKMTMLGRLQTQKLLRQMLQAGCTHAVVETSSEGILQSRHVGIAYDILVFTNLTPEHLEAHGGFNNYKTTKLRLFADLEKRKSKVIAGKKIPRTIVANIDSEHAKDFLNFEVDQKIVFSLSEKLTNISPQPLIASSIEASATGSRFNIGKVEFTSPLLGAFNTYNNLAAISVLYSLGKNLIDIARLLPQTKPCPGRLEVIDEGQNFSVIVDYAFEPNAMNKLYETVLALKKPAAKIIHVLGGTGGGRDKARRPIIGGIAAQNAAYVIVTNEDPYDEDPREIINQVANGAKGKGKIEGQNLFKIMDRREAIAKAFSLATQDDIVLLTGKGSEQAIVVKNNKKIPWDERAVAREELKKVNRKIE
ncbi:MAG: UDP-N-acetylmuramyl-tripeptide synthetase [Patescibacteria group bacterium]